MRFVAAALAATALAATALAAPLRAQQPASGVAYEQAVAARLAGRPEEAVRLLEPLVAAEPGNADAQVQLGYAYLALDLLDQAQRAFDAALAVAPDYADARLGRARIAQRRGQRDAALGELATVDPANPDAQALRAQIEAEPRAARWALDVDGGYAFVEGPQPDWKEASVQLRHNATAQTAVAARIEYSNRFDQTDVYLEGSLEHEVADGARIYVLFGGTPGANFRPQWQVGAGAAVRVRSGGDATVLTIDGRAADYLSGDVQTLSPGIEQYFAGGRAWVTARWINVFDEAGHHSGYLLRGDVQPSEDVRLFAGFSNAPDTSEGVVLDTSSYFGGVSFELGQGITARASVSFEEVETGTDRTQVGAGLGWRF